MLKFIWLIMSIILVILIFLRTPQNQGLTSFSSKSNLLGSPSSAEQFLNNLTIILMLAYFLFAIFLNSFDQNKSFIQSSLVLLIVFYTINSFIFRNNNVKYHLKLTRSRAVWQLVGLITRRSMVQIHSPLKNLINIIQFIIKKIILEYNVCQNINYLIKFEV